MIKEQSGVRLLMLQVTDRCNLDCRYCYSHQTGGGQDMTWEVARKAVDRFVSHGHRMVVQLTGGEPLLRPDYIEPLVAYTREKNPRAAFSLQTNATLLDESEINNIRDLGLGLAISMDGIPEVNDRQRGGSRKVVHALSLLEKVNTPVNVTAVLTRNNVEKIPDFLLFLSNFSVVRVLNLDILRTFKSKNDEKILPPAPDQLTRLAEKLPAALDFINRRRFPPLVVREISRIENWVGSEGDCYCEAAAGRAVAVNPAGHLYPCASLIGIDGYQMGSIMDPVIQRYGKWVDHQKLNRRCRDCELMPICRGRCPSRRISYQDYSPEYTDLDCHFNRQLYQKVVQT
jgi:uncharacterized protein